MSIRTVKPWRTTIAPTDASPSFTLSIWQETGNAYKGWTAVVGQHPGTLDNLSALSAANLQRVRSASAHLIAFSGNCAVQIAASGRHRGGRQNPSGEIRALP